MKKIKININSKRKLSEQRNFNFRDSALAKKRSQPKSRAEKLLQSYINELEKPKLHRADYVGMKWSDSENNYVSTTEPGEISRAIGEVVWSLDMQNPPERASDVGRNRLETAEWIYSTRTQGAAMGRGLRRGKDGKASSENFMAQYDGSVSFIPGKLNKRAKWFIKTWRTICSFAEYIVNVSDAGPKVVAPRNPDGSIMTRAQHMRMMKRNAAKLSKRDRLGPIERALYDMNPDNQPSLLRDMVIAILDPRGPWGFAGRNKDGKAINNWQAFKDSVSDLKNVRTPFDLQWGLGMVALSGLGLIPFVPSPSKAGGAGARGISRAVKTAKGVNAEAALIASRIKKAAKQAEKAGEMSKAQRAKVTTKADEILAVTKHNDEIIKKYGKQGCCIKKGINESIRILEQQIFCVPYQVDADGKIIDPVTNGGAYNLQPGDYILGPSNKKGKRNHFTVERTPTNTSRAIVYNAKKFAGATVRAIKNNRQFALWRRDAKVGDRFTITYVADGELAKYAKGAIRDSNGRPIGFGDEIADVAIVNPDMFGDFTKAKIQNVEMVEITFTVKDGAKFDRPGAGGATMSQNPYAGGAWYTSSGKGALENPKTGAIEVDSYPQGLGVVHVDVGIPPKTFGEPDLQKVHNAITDRMNHELRHAADPGGGGVPLTAGEIRKQGKFIVDDDYVVLDLADEAVIYMNQLPSWRGLNQPWDVRYRLSPNEINAFVSEIYRSITFTNKQIKQAARRAGKKPKKITFEELVDEQLDQVVKRADKQARQRQGNLSPEQYQQLVQMDIPKVKEAWMDHAKKFFPCALLRNGQKINPGACKRTVKEYIERVVLEELEKTLQDYQNN